ncbi:MAG: enoyl-CoA hydratase/isomerase family protein [bacterium]|nr:enoyl-CoA hydratase/isomerase family protein [bacterium]
MTSLKHLKLERDGHVATVFLHRPKQLNALNLELMSELVSVLDALESDDEIRSVVLTGDERAFAAGADITDMADADSTEMLRRNQFAKWERIRKFSKPLIAAVSGFALGGGCELVMHCDMVIASETAQFGQPEIKLGVIPGAGGTQRLTRTVGKQHAMELVLTGKFISAKQAEAWGMVNRVVPIESYLNEAQKLAREIAQMSPIAVRLAKESVLKVYDAHLAEGLEFERKNFYLLFNTEDQKEGMKAFIEKRPAKFRGK